MGDVISKLLQPVGEVYDGLRKGDTGTVRLVRAGLLVYALTQVGGGNGADFWQMIANNPDAFLTGGLAMLIGAGDKNK